MSNPIPAPEAEVLGEMVGAIAAVSTINLELLAERGASMDAIIATLRKRADEVMGDYGVAAAILDRIAFDLEAAHCQAKKPRHLTVVTDPPE